MRSGIDHTGQCQSSSQFDRDRSIASSGFAFESALHCIGTVVLVCMLRNCAGATMPSLSSTPTCKDRKTSTPCTNLTTTPGSLRRGLVKPLGEHNRSTRTRSPAPASPKRNPATKKTVLTGGDDLSRRLADSMCFNSPSRTGTAFKSRVLDTPPVKKAITFSTPRKQNSIRKQENQGFAMEDHGRHMKTPEAQPSELSKRAMESPGGGMESSTPSPQPTTSPEFLKRGGSVPPSSGGCYGAGTLIGMPSVKDRRKCKPRGILTIEAELLLHCEEEEEQVEVRDTSFVPAMASVEWMVSEHPPLSPIATQDSELVFKTTF